MQIVADPKVIGNTMVLDVTDGTNVEHLEPSSSLRGIKDIVTQVKVLNTANEFKKLKVSNFTINYNQVGLSFYLNLCKL